MSTKAESIVLGGGCFWCLEAAYQLINGVEKVTSGYAGGHTSDPSYWHVVRGMTGHAEVVKLEFDPSVIDLAGILEVFWVIHDPTTLNQQGHDTGEEYRSIILYVADEQKRVIEGSVAAAQEAWDGPITTEVKPLDKFYEAEAEHQNFFKNHSEQAYCQVIINPKLDKLRRKFAARLKSQ